MDTARRIFDAAAKEGRFSLAEAEIYDIFDSLGLKTPKRVLLPAGRPVPDFEGRIGVVPGEKLVIKVSSSKTLHKTESGGIKVCAREEAAKVVESFAVSFPEAEGFLVCEFVEHAVFALGQELMLGARADKAFGPVITLGVGGTDAEALTASLKAGRSPAITLAAELADAGAARRFLDSAWIWKYASGAVRGGRRLAADAEILKWIHAFAALVAEFSDRSGADWAIEEIEVNPLAVANGWITALDGVLRFRKSAPGGRVAPGKTGVRALLRPQTIAVAGVSDKKMNMGRIILNNIIRAGFPIEKLWVIKDGKRDIDGARCCASAKDLPGAVDMFVVAVPSKEVPAALRDAAESGKVKGVVLISGGMGEKTGSENVKDEVLKIIESGKKINPDFCLSGGNSLGIVSNPSKVNTLFIPQEKLMPPLGAPPPGTAGTAFISQSGAFVIVVESKMPYLKPVYSVTVGNQMDVTVADYVENVCEEPGIGCILIYVEGLKEGDGTKLAASVKKAASLGKSVVFYKAGRTPTGQKAVMGHTASIAGDYAVSAALLSRAGACVVSDFTEFEDVARLCANCGARPAGGRVFMLSNAGFEAAGMADNIVSGGPLSAPQPQDALADEMQKALVDFRLDLIVDLKNPLDVTPMAPDEAIRRIAELALKSGQYDSVIVSPVPLTPAMKTLESEGLADSLPVKLAELRAACRKPVIFCVAAGGLYDSYCKIAEEAGLSVFRSCDRAVRALARVAGESC